MRRTTGLGWRATMAALSSVLAVAVGVPQASASRSAVDPTVPSAIPAVSAEPDDPTEVMAAKQLSRDVGVTYDVALTRVLRQPVLEDLAARFASERPTTAAGAYIDHQDGGRLVILDTAPTNLDRYVPASLAGLVRVERAGWSTQELLEYGADLQRRSGLEPMAMPITTDVRSNTIEVFADVDSAAGQRVAAAASDYATRNGRSPVIVHDGRRDLELTANCQTYFQLCDAPLRGGVGIRNGTDSVCTAGFNVVSQSDNKRYVLTAGHCTAISGAWITEFKDQSVHTIGDSHSSYFPSVDAGLVRVNNVSGWNQQWWVLVRASYGYPPTSNDEEYPITSAGISVPGSYYCKTGATTGTGCGGVVAVGATHPDLGILNMGVAGIYNCQGDSGGPVYKGNKAYGISVAGDNQHFLGTYTYDTGLWAGAVNCYSTSWYTGIGQALAVTNTKLIGT